MGTLVLDIETASPFGEPPSATDTEYFELLSVALAYVGDGESAEDAETAVLFRRGGWDDEHAADLLTRLFEWCESRDVERTLTYNGARFDLPHLRNWAASLERSGALSDARRRLVDCLGRHVDVARAAADRHEGELWDEQVILPDWKAYRLEGIRNDPVRYRDYDFHPHYFDALGIDDPMVKGMHVGRVLGERYVEGVVAGLEETHTHRELRRLLSTYALSDVTDLYELYESLGGATLDAEYCYPVDGADSAER